MEKLTPINKALGKVIYLGLILTQLIVFVAFSGTQVFIVSFLSAGIFIPFVIVGYVSTLDREKYKSKIRTGLIIGIGTLILIPTLFPLFFDDELKYLSLIGIGLGITLWLVRKSTELQLLIVNIFGSMLILLSLFTGAIELMELFD